MPLTANQAKHARPTEKAYKLADKEGLYLLVSPNGSKYWRLKYRFAGKEKVFAVGVYPTVTLADAREVASDAKKLVNKGIDPVQAKKAEKRARENAAINTFKAIATRWYDKQKPNWVEGHSKRVLRALERDLYPSLGGRPINEITAPELLHCLERIEKRNAFETAHKTKQYASQVFRFAIAGGLADFDPAASLNRSLAKPPATKHFASVTDPAKVGPLLNKTDSYSGTPQVQAALKLAPYVFVRPGELRKAEWTEVDLEAAEWRIPATKMKMREDHIVPLSRQAVAILEELQLITGDGKYVFPGGRTKHKPLSENAVLSAMRRLNIGKDELCGHGFRAMARTILDEQLGFRVDLIEHQLAHAVRDANGRAYNRTAFLPQRKEMMQKWADYLDLLKVQAASENVLTGNFGTR